MEFVLSLLIALSFSLEGKACEHFSNENPAVESYNSSMNTETSLQGGLSEEEFNEILDTIEKVYASIVAEELGLKLHINRKWEDDTLNAFAMRHPSYPEFAILEFTGGLARHHTMTEAGFALVACHEVGHHMAGAPLNPRGMSSEGQSDYFATSKCLRYFYKYKLEKDPSLIFDFENEHYMVQSLCKSQFSDEVERAICEKSTSGGQAVANFFASMRGVEVPEILDLSRDEVDRTFEMHPIPQCRLDTYFQGALCNISETVNFSSQNTTDGACTRDEGHYLGVRPLCWYNPTEGNIFSSFASL